MEKITVEMVFPIYENCNVILDTVGKYWIHEFNRWGESDEIRKTSTGYAHWLIGGTFPMDINLADYPSRTGSSVSGEISVD